MNQFTHCLCIPTPVILELNKSYEETVREIYAKLQIVKTIFIL